MQKEFDLTYLFIAHDLSVVKHVSDKIGVMYLGKLVELAESEELYKSASPVYYGFTICHSNADPKIEKKKRVVLEGDVPSPINPPSGCRFHHGALMHRISAPCRSGIKNYSDEKIKIVVTDILLHVSLPKANINS